MWDGKTRAYVTVPYSQSNQVKGLCGNFNNRQDDDFMTKENIIESNPNIFGKFRLILLPAHRSFSLKGVGRPSVGQGWPYRHLSPCPAASATSPAAVNATREGLRATKSISTSFQILQSPMDTWTSHTVRSLDRTLSSAHTYSPVDVIASLLTVSETSYK